MKLYTRGGDDGGTQLFGGRRVSKDSLRLEAFGTVDELNSHLGLVLSAGGDAEPLAPMLARIQSDLFIVGADLATPSESSARGRSVPLIGADDAARMERWIDRVCEALPELTRFILPGGCERAARLHVARGVCRRAERAVVRLSAAEPVNPQIVPFLNRLGDWLFAAARLANRQAGVTDVPWIPAKADHHSAKEGTEG